MVRYKELADAGGPRLRSDLCVKTSQPQAFQLNIEHEKNTRLQSYGIVHTSYVESDFVLERLSGRVEVDHVHRSPGVLAVLLHDLAVRGLARACRPHHHLGHLLTESHDTKEHRGRSLACPLAAGLKSRSCGVIVDGQKLQQ